LVIDILHYNISDDLAGIVFPYFFRRCGTWCGTWDYVLLSYSVVVISKMKSRVEANKVEYSSVSVFFSFEPNYFASYLHCLRTELLNISDIRRLH